MKQGQVWSFLKNPTDIGILLGTLPSPSQPPKLLEPFWRVLLPCQGGGEFSAQLHESLFAMPEQRTGGTVYVPPDVFARR